MKDLQALKQLMEKGDPTSLINKKIDACPTACVCHENWVETKINFTTTGTIGDHQCSQKRVFLFMKNSIQTSGSPVFHEVPRLVVWHSKQAG